MINYRKSKFRIVTLVLLIAGCAQFSQAASQYTFYVSPEGSDSNRGTAKKPFKTIAHAQKHIRKTGAAGKKPITVYLREGTYYLDETIKFVPEDSGSKKAPIVFQAYKDKKVIISGGIKLDLKWTPHSNTIIKASVPADLVTEQLFVNGKRRHLARFPNFSPHVRFFNGVAQHAVSGKRVARWKNPTGGYLHSLHNRRWGSLHFLITGKKGNGELVYEGGWQHRWKSPPHRKLRFVENVFEELDAPDEWFLDRKNSTLYYYPPKELDISKARFEAVRLERLFEFAGSEGVPVRFITLRGLTLTHTSRTFMKTKDRMTLSDWAICRSGAVFINGTEDCNIENCTIENVGGNAVFVNHYNRRTTIRGTHIFEAGASGVAFAGDRNAVRPRSKTLQELDKTPGPKTNNFPKDCLVEDCLMHDLGRVEKQVAGVQISMAQDILVRHCSIYTVPRAGINIGCGAWGGHIIEYCDVFDTVLETSDHGAFNCWGRDRYDNIKGLDYHNLTTGEYKNIPRLDAVKLVTLRNSRWHCSHGWDIDLDNGAVDYHVYNNLCLRGGIKLREGYYRRCENNVLVNNSMHPHVWYRKSEDVVRCNIVFRQYRPVGMGAWGKEWDYNLYHDINATGQPAKTLQRQNRRDKNSIRADAMFMDPDKMDYRVKDGSPALKLGFKNFPMDKFGVTSPRLKKLARTPKTPRIEQRRKVKDVKQVAWQGLLLSELGEGEFSAWAVSKDAGGLKVTKVAKATPGNKAGIKRDDLIMTINDIQMKTLNDLKKLKPKGPYKITGVQAGTGTPRKAQIP